VSEEITCGDQLRANILAWEQKARRIAADITGDGPDRIEDVPFYDQRALRQRVVEIRMDIGIDKRIWTFGRIETAKLGDYGFETFDYGNQIGLWIKYAENKEPIWTGLSREQAVALGLALASVGEPR
jgi:hypothetical protein